MITVATATARLSLRALVSATITAASRLVDTAHGQRLAHTGQPGQAQRQVVQSGGGGRGQG